MKYNIFILGGLAALCLAACQKQGTKETAFQSEFTYHLTQNDSCTLEITDSLAYYETFEGGDALRDQLNATIFKMVFAKDEGGKSLQEAFDAHCKEASEDYQKEIGEFYQDILNDIGEDEEFPFYQCRWTENTTSSFGVRIQDLQGYNLNAWNYQGGAHGMFYEIPKILNLKTGEEVTESMLFKEGYKEPLTELIRKNAKKKYNGVTGDPYETLTEESLVPNDFCGIARDGVLWKYQPYEAAAYASGIISVTVPWEDLKDWINPEYLDVEKAIAEAKVTED